MHYLSETATAAYEHARRIAREFLNAGEDREVIFTSNCTDGINLVAHGYGRKFIGAGDEIILTHLEHHANIVPWQMLCEEKGARLRIVPVTDAGELVLDEYEQLFNARTKFVAITHVSNALGTINPVKAMIATAHGHGVPVLVDGAQAAPHLTLDVRDLDCDFYAITGHKIFGPDRDRRALRQGAAARGDAALQGRRRHDPVGDVREDDLQPHPAQVRGRYAADRRGDRAGRGDGVRERDRPRRDRRARARAPRVRDRAARGIPGVRLIGTAKDKASVLSFYVGDVHPHDVGTLLNQEGVAVRTGHHCAQPLMQRFGVPATARASFAFYNTFGEVEALAAAVRKVQKMFA